MHLSRKLLGLMLSWVLRISASAGASDAKEAPGLVASLKDPSPKVRERAVDGRSDRTRLSRSCLIDCLRTSGIG